jgi:hypothetical protein
VEHTYVESAELLLEIQALYEDKLLDCQTIEEQLSLCLHAVFHIVGFVGGFRGEEMPMLSLDAMAKYLAYDQLADPKLAHVMIALRGKVKGERKAEACHLVQIVAVTKSGLKPRLWVQRAVEAYHRMGITNGWMFRNSKGAPSRQKGYEQLLFALIQEVIEIFPSSQGYCRTNGIRNWEIYASRVCYTRDK